MYRPRANLRTLLTHNTSIDVGSTARQFLTREANLANISNRKAKINIRNMTPEVYSHYASRANRSGVSLAI